MATENNVDKLIDDSVAYADTQQDKLVDDPLAAIKTMRLEQLAECRLKNLKETKEREDKI
ncbi:hypothetical protein [uncultured Amphritea sp.]|uniref:hypothetical protein n=1 Tax=uncultured Amphritea sp. TaxID=981605 RepID=UPI0025EE1027|nr:hypothetical protein [uncultured Amphritea sp.]